MSQTTLLRRPERALQKRSKDIRMKLKVIVVGDTLVGKSSLIKRYCEDGFQRKYVTTIGIDYGVRPVKVDDKLVGIHFWDTSGRPEFSDVRNEFYKDADVFIMAFDLTNKNSFVHLANWLAEYSKYCGDSERAIKVVVGTKLDKDGRVVDKREANGWAQNNGFIYFETSSANAEGVFEMFDGVFKTAVKQKAPK